MKRFRTYIVTGLLVWLPLGITAFLVKFMVDFVDRSLLLLPLDYRPDTLLNMHIPGLGIVLTLMVLLITGVLAANFFGRKLVNIWESILQRIPLVRSVYSAAKSFAEVVLTDNTESFKEVLLIEYPRKGLYSLCFQTSTSLGEVQARTGEEVICVFVPTTPNPTSGVMIIVPKKDVIVLDMQVEEAVKMVVSLGVVVPDWNGRV
ncbi:MAG: DUF502 domain-containing protein [Gammaproteobacteria bacterium]|nr:DUF502 domain-containing protein [Gammaproteobacteria bacterium]MCP4088635.1 DUF502 domain-containing protein [Gammaproteobacteria bacterium]MCP4276457.1 DUF502 domain-containing protein [Gammaproteobacteria bacterium]MCP4832334.1 DUF502 domain-containing protein [Gammaproteobacteria bacterium]MCP4929152.1 DUF502 domain-containing protein [Gammaproteobacteria bacterium]